MERARSDFQQQEGRNPANSELADLLGITEERLEKIQTATPDAISLELQTDKEGRTKLTDLIPDPNASDPEASAAEKSVRNEIMRFLDNLRPMEAEVLILRFGLNDEKPRNLEECGRVLGVSRERVRQLEISALRQLRSPANARRLREATG